MMTNHARAPALTLNDVADASQVLEQLLPHGYSLAHSRSRWYLRRWDSWVTAAGPRMSWRDVDSDLSLPVLLVRLLDAHG